MQIFTENPSPFRPSSASSLSWKSGVFSLLILSAVLTGLRLQLQESSQPPKMNFSTGMKNLKFLVDSDIVVTITAQNSNGQEGTGSPNAFTFTVRRTVQTTLSEVVELTVDYSVTGSGGNPADAADFPGGVFPSGTFTFDAMEGPIIMGAITKTLTIYADPDTVIEPDEGFTITLSNPMASGGSGGNMSNTAQLGFPSSATGTILNDDPSFAECIPEHVLYLDEDCNISVSASDFVTNLMDTCVPAGGLSIEASRGPNPGPWFTSLTFTGLDIPNITDCESPPTDTLIPIYIRITNTCGGIDTVFCSVLLKDTIPPTITCPPDTLYCQDPCLEEYNWIHPIPMDNCAVGCLNYQVEAFNNGQFLVIDPSTGDPSPGLLSPFEAGGPASLLLDCDVLYYRIRYYIRDVHGNPPVPYEGPACEFILVHKTILDCGIGNDTLYVSEDGTIPPVPVDSFLLDTVSAGCSLWVNGVEYNDTESLVFTCENLSENLLDLMLICGEDTLCTCSKIITILDTFPKNLVCNDLVNLSLGTSCMKVVSTDDVLENIMGCREVVYDIQLIYPFGTSRYPEEDKVDLSHIGYTMVYNAYETATGNKCWGYIKVEDKQPPLLNCSVDTITCYELPDLPLLAQGEDSCSGVEVKIVSDQWTDYGCAEDPVLSGYVVRTIQASDKWGNFARCTDTIFIRKTVLDSLVCPELIELPCEITHQLYGSKSELKTPITVDKSKVTPEYLLSLQKANWELKAGGKGAILDPAIIVVPQIEGKNIYPAAGGSCKITAIFKDTDLDVCGAGFKVYRKWIVTDWCTQEEEICEQYIKVIDTSAPKILKTLSTIYANTSPHDCVAGVVLPALVAGTDFKDCGVVKQTYTISYDDPSHPGKTIVFTGELPSKTLYLPQGEFEVVIDLVDACFNRSQTRRNIVITDITPPTPVCNEITQVTIDPATCWAVIAAKDLDNGSRDNCCGVLHFAAAYMDSIEYWTKYWNELIEAEVGPKAYLKRKATYDSLVNDWINAYVFSDSIHFSDCGPSANIVLRVYEACGVPAYDPHVFPCSPHAWFWYNTFGNFNLFRADFNFNWFDPKGPRSCRYRPELGGYDKMVERYTAYGMLGYFEPKYPGATRYDPCEEPFYEGPSAYTQTVGALVPGGYCSRRLYNDCMVQVLVDDKQAPEVHHLEDITVYCDNSPHYAAYPKDCSTGKKNGIWPGYLKDSEGTIHGYYGGLGYYDEEEHGPDCGHYDHQNNWAPKYCREWLYLDSFDTAGQINPQDYFDHYVLFDKDRPQRELEEDEFSITDNCRLDDASLTYTDEGDLNSCGEGWIQRTWTIRDACGNEVTAKQKVLVKHRSDFEVVFPEDKVVECDFLNTTDPEDTGEPEVTDDECEQVGLQYKDEIYSIREGEEDGACYKIIRTWTLIDWCIYDPRRTERHPEVIVDDRLRADTGNRECVYRNLKDNNDGYMQYIQVIKVVDRVAPVVNTRDTIVCIYGEECTTNVIIPLSGTDNCAEPSHIRFRVLIDLDASEEAYTGRLFDANSIEQGGTRYETEFVFLSGQPGKHLVHVIGEDPCGNADTSTFRFELRDCKRPTPYCYSGLATVIMPSTGNVTVWAKDLDVGSSDNCTEHDNLIFSFSADITQTSKVFTCADLPDGRSRTIPVEIWVMDEAGNQDHCNTYLLLQDNVGNVCPDVAGLNVQIAGTVRTEDKEPVEHVTMNVHGVGLQLNYETGVKGSYHFEALPSKSDYTIRARRKDRPMNGVSTLDLILIQKHILGTEPLDSPYKIIAADADNDKQVTAIDLVELRKLILSTYEELPNAESWKFVPKAQQFSDPKNPWNFKTWMEMKQVEKDYMQEDWIGIKTGDVNASAAPHSLLGTEVRENNRGLIFEVVDRQFMAGELVTVEFRSPNFRGISGFQGTIEVVSGQWSVVSLLNPQSSILNPYSGVLKLSGQNFGLRKASEGLLTMSWNANTGVDVPEREVLFTLTFKAGQNGRLSEALRMGSQVTIAESYEGKGEVSNLGIRFVSPEGNEVNAKSELYQNYPNPFDQRTVIGLRLAKEGRGTLSIHDVTGRTIRSIERDWTKGYHEVWLDRREIGATGVLYYRFESGFFTDSRKMVLVE